MADAANGAYPAAKNVVGAQSSQNQALPASFAQGLPPAYQQQKSQDGVASYQREREISPRYNVHAYSGQQQPAAQFGGRSGSEAWRSGSSDNREQGRARDASPNHNARGSYNGNGGNISGGGRYSYSNSRGGYGDNDGGSYGRYGGGSNGYNRNGRGNGYGGYNGRGGYGSSYNGNGYGRYGSQGGAGRNSPAPTPPCWVRAGSWLLPKTGSRDEQSHAQARANLLAAAPAVGSTPQQQGPTAAVAAPSSEQALAPVTSVIPAPPAATAAGPSNQQQQVVLNGVQVDLAVDHVVYLMRGLPGSGKSTTAQHISEQALKALQESRASSNPSSSSNGRIVAIHSTDSYFIGQDGVYKFDATLLQVRYRCHRFVN